MLHRFIGMFHYFPRINAQIGVITRTRTCGRSFMILVVAGFRLMICAQQLFQTFVQLVVAWCIL
jgi:hypothetical protein